MYDKDGLQKEYGVDPEGQQMRPSVGSIQVTQCLRVHFYLLFTQAHGHNWFSSSASSIHSKFHYHLLLPQWAVVAHQLLLPSLSFLKGLSLYFSELLHIPIHIIGQGMAVDVKVYQRATLASLPTPSWKQQPRCSRCPGPITLPGCWFPFLLVVSNVVWCTLTGEEAWTSTVPVFTSRRLCYLKSGLPILRTQRFTYRKHKISCRMINGASFICTP